MKQFSLFCMAIGITCFASMPPSLLAAPPQPGLLQVAVVDKTVSLGEPIILKYKVTNVEDRKISSNISDEPEKWLSIKLTDSSGHSVEVNSNSALRPRRTGISIGENSSHIGLVVLSLPLQPTHPGQYVLKLLAHQLYFGDIAPIETAAIDQDFSLPVTVIARDPERLHFAAEKLCKIVLHDNEYQWAIKALFTMRDPECLSVWRELTTDPTLDAFRATDVINGLAGVGSLDATNLLSEMHPIVPERWARTGLDPLGALENIRRTASPDLKQHINQLLLAAGINPNHIPFGSVN